MNQSVSAAEMDDFIAAGASVEVRNGGHHWIVTLGNTRLDYWPSSERYQLTWKGPVQRGFKKALAAIRSEAPKKRSP